MSSFAEEMHQIRQTRRLESAQKEASVNSDWFREDCEPYIQYTCDAIRCEIKQAALDGNVHYDTVQDEGKEPKRINTPYYCTYWSVECELDLTKDDFLWEGREQRIKLSDPQMFFYILEQIEKRLWVDGIYSADLIAESKVHVFRLFESYVKTTMVRTHLLKRDACEELRTAQAQYEQGIGSACCKVYMSSYFAYDTK